MSRLIDADAISYCSYDLDNYHSFRAVTDEDIAEMPTINPPDDLRPRGQWIVRKNMLGIEGMLGIRCSLCGRYWALPEKTPEEFKGEYSFCPNCGARMEE